MFETLIAYAQTLSVYAKEYPAVAGAITLWFAGVATYFFRNVPARLWDIVSAQFVTSLTINNTGHGNAEELFQGFMRWFNENGMVFLSREMAIEDGMTDGVGDGTHYFFYKGRLFWFHKYRLQSSGVYIEKREIAIKGLTRSRKLLEELIGAFSPKKEDDRIQMYNWQMNENERDSAWVSIGTVRERTRDSLAIDDDVFLRLTGEIDRFVNNQSWYCDKGVSHKLGIVLHGEPGTGKTTLAKLLASIYDRNLCIMSLAGQTDRSLHSAFSQLPANSIVLIEDIHSYGFLHSEDYVNEVRACQTEKYGYVGITPIDVGPRCAVSLSGFLNAIDGVYEYDNVMIVMTTNYLSRIEPAVYRKGRGDVVLEIGDVSHSSILKYLQTMFPDHDVHTLLKSRHPDGCFRSEKGSVVEAVYKEHSDDVEACIDNLVADIRLSNWVGKLKENLNVARP